MSVGSVACVQTRIAETEAWAQGRCVICIVSAYHAFVTTMCVADSFEAVESRVEQWGGELAAQISTSRNEAPAMMFAAMAVFVL